MKNFNSHHIRIGVLDKSKINLASKSLLSLINDVLDISKIESQKLTLEVAPFDLNALLARISSMFEQSAEQKGINWHDDFVYGLTKSDSRRFI